MAQTGAFAVSTTATSVRLGAGGTARVDFTVTNTSHRNLNARSRIVSEPPGQESWFSVPAEQPCPVDSTQQFTVTVSVPAGATASSSRFRLEVSGVEDPDEYSGLGPWVSLEVSAKPPQPLPWRWILIAAAALVVVIAVVLVVVLRPHTGGGKGKISFEPASLRMGGIVGGSPAADSVTITNTGGADLVVRRAALTGASGPFRVTANHCDGRTLHPNQSCSVTISLGTGTAGTFTNVLEVDDGEPAGSRPAAHIDGTVSFLKVSVRPFPLPTAIVTRVP